MGLKTVVFCVTLAMLGGCADDPSDFSDSGGSPGSAQALTQCRAQANSSPALSNATANPLFAAAMQQQMINDCMAAAGYKVR